MQHHHQFPASSMPNWNHILKEEEKGTLMEVVRIWIAVITIATSKEPKNVGGTCCYGCFYKKIEHIYLCTHLVRGRKKVSHRNIFTINQTYGRFFVCLLNKNDSTIRPVKWSFRTPV